MATEGDFNRQLNDKDIVALAAAIPADNMAAIAEGYMDISDATIKNKKYENTDDNAEAFNREVLKTLEKYEFCIRSSKGNSGVFRVFRIFVVKENKSQWTTYNRSLQFDNKQKSFY